MNLEFWFSIGSTYTALTVMRMNEIERLHNITLRLMPFSVRRVMLDMDNVPFPASKASKVTYMWRDIERRAAIYGFPVKVPAPYPLQEFDRANKIAFVGAQEGWIKDYVLQTYKNWFQHGLEAGGDANLKATFKTLSLDVKEILARTQASEIDKLYEEQTSVAVKKGIFGSPTFIVGGEVFWGDDRLEDAISWLKNQSKS
ncbi:MAG: DsbA family protein [Pseudomonadota bacterium]|nr:DsbA family protein [Pseudomonadota bacterium]